MNDTILEKLKKRKIWKTFVGYPAASFVILQAVDFFIAKYGLNPKALTFTLIVLCGGFIIALIWNWLHGEEGHQNFTKKETVSYGFIGLLALILAFYFSSQSQSHALQVVELNSQKSYRLAVLPFETIAGDASMDYLSEGIPENLINRLSQNTKLQLVSKASSFILDSEFRNSKDVLKHLNANLMLTGKVQRIDGSLIVNCQLTDTENNTQIWGDKVAHKSDDILELEKQMVTSLMNKLPKKFKTDQVVSKSWSENSEAQVHYMKGKALSYGSTKEEEDLALNHFREAIKLDPDFVAAYVAIANEQQVQAMFATDTRAAIFNEARLAVQTALNLNPNYGEAYTVDAAIKFYQDQDWEGAEASYKKAIRLDPNNANALIRYSFFLTTFKRHEEALSMANKAIELDPISISSLHNLGWSNLVAGNYAKAEKAFSDAVEIHPNWAWGYVKRAYSLMYQNKCDLALKDKEKARELLGDWGSELLEACFIFILDTCNYDKMKDVAIEKYLAKINSDNYTDPLAMGLIFAAKGDYDEAIRWYQIAIDEKTTSFYQFTLDYIYPEEILQDPRFKQMKRDLNLPQ